MKERKGNAHANNSTSTLRPGRGVGFIVAIACAAVVIGIVSYLYSDYNSAQIVASSERNTDRTAKIQTNDLGSILKNKVENIESNVMLIAQSKRVMQHEVEEAAPMFTTSQQSTHELTDSYFWIDKEGKLVWANAFTNKTLYDQYAGADRSNRAYYSVPKETQKFYISSIIESVDNVPRFYFAYPILVPASDGSNRLTYDGAIIASANLKAVGGFLNGQLSPDTQNAIGLLAKDGTILYSQDEHLLGLNYWGEEFQKQLPNELKPKFNAAIRDSLQDNNGIRQVTLSYQGNSGSITSTPITVDENTFAVVYVVAPHTPAQETLTMLDNQKIFTILYISAISGIALASAAAIYRWNRNLSLVIAEKTADLESRTRELEFSNNNLKSKSQELEQALSTIEESNEQLAKANEELKVHDKLQKEFVNVAAHELRTPIQPLLGAAEIMGEQMKDKEVIEVSKAEVDMIIRNAKRLERLSSDILEISRLESGSLKLAKERFSLSYIIADAIKDAKARSNFRDEKLKLSFTPDDLFVYADKEKAIQVVSNLLSNAIKFTDSGSISISSTPDASGTNAIVSIRDTGRGIDPDVAPRLFEKFVSKSEKGTGIGLYISKKIVEAHGGQIWGENNPEGDGATFGFTLPLATKQQLENL